MRISDWSSDVCSSDLPRSARARRGGAVSGVPISGRNPRRVERPVPPRGAQRAAQGARVGTAVGRRFPETRAREGGAAQDGHGHTQASGERRLFGGREEAQRAESEERKRAGGEKGGNERLD